MIQAVQSTKMDDRPLEENEADTVSGPKAKSAPDKVVAFSIDQEFRYNEIEAILAGVFRIYEPIQINRLRERFKKFQRLGLPNGKRPKRGTNDKYSIQQLCQILIAFQILSFGMDPTTIAFALLVSEQRSDGTVYTSPVSSLKMLLTNSYPHPNGLQQKIVMTLPPAFLTLNVDVVLNKAFYKSGPEEELLADLEKNIGLLVVSLSALAQRTLEVTKPQSINNGINPQA